MHIIYIYSIQKRDPRMHLNEDSTSLLKGAPPWILGIRRGLAPETQTAHGNGARRRLSLISPITAHDFL